MKREFDAYRILQIDPDAEQSVLEAAYRALARLYHPDGRTPNVERMSAINRAYDLIRSPDRRRQHDIERMKGVGPGQAPGMRPVAVPPTRAESWSLRSAAKRAEEHASSAVLDFGRYEGWRLRDLVRHDPDYLRWLARHSSGFRFRREILDLLGEDQELIRHAKSMR